MTAPRPAPGADAPAGWTTLRALDGRLAKVIRQEGDGPVEVVDYDKAFLFEAEAEAVLTTRDLYHRLAELQDDPQSCIVRGAPIDGTDLSGMRRLAHDKPDAAATLTDVEREIAFFDFDLEMTEDEAEKYQIVDDPDAAVDYALELGPAALREADLVWSFGASAGIKPRKLSLHFSTLTDRPALGSEIKAIVEKWNEEAGRTLFDSSIYGPQSIVYTARPVFEGDAIDPLEGYRIGMRNGKGRPLVLPAIETAPPPPAPGPGVPIEGEAPEEVALVLLSELCGRAWAEMLVGKKTRQEIAVGVFTQLRDCRVRPELAHGASRALHRAANDPGVLRTHGGRRKPLSWFLELAASIYGTAPRDPRPDVAEAMKGDGKAAPVAGLCSWRSIGDVLRNARPRAPIPTGFDLLDSTFFGGGFSKGEAIALGGPPGSLKTTLEACFAAFMAGPLTYVGFAAFDEPEERVAAKVGSRFGEAFWRLNADYQSVLESLEERLAIKDTEVVFVDPLAGPAVEDILETFAAKVPAGRTGVLFLDHLHALSTRDAGERDSEFDTIRKVSSAVALLTRRLQIITVSIAEVMKAASSPEAVRANPLAAFAGTRKIASLFTVPMVCIPSDGGGMELIIAKNRLGPRGSAILNLNPDTWALTVDSVRTSGKVGEAENRTTVTAKADDDVLTKFFAETEPVTWADAAAALRSRGIPKDRALEARRRLVNARGLEEGEGPRPEGSRRGPVPSVWATPEKLSETRRNSAKPGENSAGSGVSLSEKETRRASAPVKERAPSFSRRKPHSERVSSKKAFRRVISPLENGE